MLHAFVICFLHTLQNDLQFLFQIQAYQKLHEMNKREYSAKKTTTSLDSSAQISMEHGRLTIQVHKRCNTPEE